MAHSYGGRGAMTRNKGTKGKGKLQKDPMGRQVPGFIEKGSVGSIDARGYAGMNRKKGPDHRSTTISLPGKY